MKTNQLIIALNVLLFGAMLAVAGTGQIAQFSTETLLRFGANYGPLVRDGQWWRMVSAMFIHVTPLHLAMNMIALYQVGVVLEPHFGRVRYVLVYVLAGLGGSVASIAWNWNHPVVSAGASGAIAGLIGAGVVAGHLIGNASAINYRNAMLRWIALIALYGFIGHIDNAAHLGGLIVGAGVAWLLDRGGAALVQRHDQKGAGLESVFVLALVGMSFGLAARAQKDALTVEAEVNRGVEQAQNGQNDEAIASYRRALRMNPNESVAHFDLALSLAHKKEYAEAASEARRATQLDAKNRSAFTILADAEQHLGHLDAAEQANKAALALAPAEPPPTPATPPTPPTQ